LRGAASRSFRPALESLEDRSTPASLLPAIVGAPGLGALGNPGLGGLFGQPGAGTPSAFGQQFPAFGPGNGFSPFQGVRENPSAAPALTNTSPGLLPSQASSPSLPLGPSSPSTPSLLPAGQDTTSLPPAFVTPVTTTNDTRTNLTTSAGQPTGLLTGTTFLPPLGGPAPLAREETLRPTDRNDSFSPPPISRSAQPSLRSLAALSGGAGVVEGVVEEDASPDDGSPLPFPPPNPDAPARAVRTAEVSETGLADDSAAPASGEASAEAVVDQVFAEACEASILPTTYHAASWVFGLPLATAAFEAVGRRLAEGGRGKSARKPRLAAS